jgi:hypothetical protein
VIFDILEYITMKRTIPNERRICRICRRVLILKKKKSVAECLVMPVTKRDRWESTSQRASNV